MPRPIPSIERLLVAVVFALAFLFMASVFVPTRSQAQRRNDPSNASTGQYSTNAHEGLKLLGELESRQYRVKVFATAAGPRYSVVDRVNGEELGTLMTAEQIARHFGEELNLPEMQAGALHGLMYVDPPSHDW